MKKILFLFILIFLTSFLYAKDLVYIPTANSVDGVSLSYDFDYNEHNHIFNVLGGFNGFEVSFTNYNNEFDKDKFIPSSKSILDAQWQFLPDFGAIPSIAVGVKDITCKLDKNPTFYAVATKDFSGYIPLEFINKLELSCGASYNSLGIFGGLNVQLGFIYGTVEKYKEDYNMSCGLSFLDDTIRVGYKRFNKSDYVGLDCSFGF